MTDSSLRSTQSEGVRLVVNKIVQHNVLSSVLETMLTALFCYFLLLPREDIRDGLSGLSTPISPENY